MGIKIAGTDPNGSRIVLAQTDLILSDTDVIGALNEFVNVPYSFGTNKILAHLNTSYYHIHGTSFVYPDHADDVELTAGAAAAWNETGLIIEVVPAAALSVSAFDLHWINIANISENATIQIDIFKGLAGSEVKIGSTRATRTTNQARNGPSRIQIPQQEPGERISCRLTSSTGNATTCDVSFEGHFYAG